ncbi:peroxiredoxin [Paucidesulfovibrio longus]|uniref:peroxiredoxin n=1 Tax=Paucidesulfovibrio longus TaxID=889 RepID=UPI0003B74A2A|nr:peroxiredoxin [Paucidesulfovibrio longus]
METSLPLLGQPMPELKVTTTHGEMNLPGDMKGKWFVLFSHPADFTPVCTTEFVAFQKRFDEFEKLGAKLIGLSIDQVFSHIKWIEWIEEKLGVEIKFPVIADDRGEVAQKLGMIHPGKGSNTVRAVFIVDPQGLLRLMLYYPQEVGRNMDEILRALKALQTSDNNGVAIPAGWPNNELIGGKVIIPPAKDTTAAKTRLSEHEGYDWWFCYRDL